MNMGKAKKRWWTTSEGFREVEFRPGDEVWYLSFPPNTWDLPQLAAVVRSTQRDRRGSQLVYFQIEVLSVKVATRYRTVQREKLFPRGKLRDELRSQGYYRD